VSRFPVPAKGLFYFLGKMSMPKYEYEPNAWKTSNCAYYGKAKHS